MISGNKDKSLSSGRAGLVQKLYSLIDPFNIIYSSIRNAVFMNRRYIKGIVLDAGCGSMPYKNFFGSEFYVGMDAKDCAYLKGSVLDLPLRSGSIDSIVCTEVLEHVDEPMQALAEFRRVMKSGGFILVTTPFMFGVHGAPNDFFRYTKYGLQSMIERTGFKVVDIRGHSNPVQVFCQAINSSLHKTFVSMGKARFLTGAPLVATWLFFTFVGRLSSKKSDDDTLGYVCVARKL